MAKASFAVLGAAALAGIAWWVLATGRPPALADDVARQTAEAFLADVRGGKADAAWAGTSAEFKSLMGRDAFRAYVRSKPALRAPATFQRCERVDRDTLHLEECLFHAAKGGAIKVVLAPEAGTWKVERLIVE